MMYWVRKYFSDLSGHMAAIYEVSMPTFFSLVPFIVTFFVESSRRVQGGFVDFEHLVNKGQLYLLAYGIYGTVFWLAFLKGDRERHGARAFLGALATLMIIPVLGYFGVDPTFSHVLNPQIVHLGYWLYGSLLTMNYLLLFYMNITPPEASEVLDREAGAMRSRYEEMKRHD